MAATSSERFVCSCFFTHNIVLKKYKLHVLYINKSQFLEQYSGILRQKGCVTETQFDNAIKEIETEVARRKDLGETTLWRCGEIQNNYVPLHKDVYQLQESNLDPVFLSLVAAAKRDKTTDALMEYMDCLGEEVYTLPVFTAEYCQRLVEELEHIEQSDCPKGRPNTMSPCGVLLNEFGFNPGLLDPLRLDYIQPITSLLFPTWGGGLPGLPQSLHGGVPPGKLTLNVCLSSGPITGGDLFLMSWRSGVDRPESVTKYKFRQGWGVLHRGLHRHGAEPLVSGRRCNLVLWLRSSRVRNSGCPMCGSPPHLVQVAWLDDGFRRSPPSSGVDVC
ncbi:hypothetical protein ACOMHN_022313 [Nucella lapillus]